MNTHKNILVIDDELEFRVLINRKLKAAGYHAVLAQNGEEALVALWEKPNIGLVLLDVRLPVINGLNISEIIRKDFPDKKIIVTSVFQKGEQRFLIDDADGYYNKSEDFSSLKEKIDNVFSNSMKGKLRENEKRNFKRIPVNVFANCERGSHDTPLSDAHFLTYTKDLSLSGGKCIVDADMKAGQHFTMALELPVNFLPLLINCEVVWARKLEEFDSKENVEVGVKFVKLASPRDEEILKNYLSCV